MALSLAITDKMDNTGASFVVSGASSPVTIWSSQFAGSLASRQFAPIGTLPSDGSIDIALPTGPHLALAIANVSEAAFSDDFFNGGGALSAQLSDPVPYRVSDGAAPMLYRCMQEVRNYIIGLALPGVSTNPEQHVLCKFPYRQDLQLDLDLTETDPTGVLYFPKPETYSPQDNETDQVMLSVHVLLVRRNGRKLKARLSQMLMDRQLISQSLSGCPLPDLPEIHTVRPIPGAVFLPEQWKLSYDCSSLVFQCL